MKKSKVLELAIICMFLLSSLFAISAVGIKYASEEQLGLGDPVPTIDGCFNTIYGHGEEISEGYARLRYDYRVQNKLDESVQIVFDWGDGQTSTSQTVSADGYLYEPHVFENGGTYSIKARYSIYDSWSEPFEIPMNDHCDLKVEIYTVPEKFTPGSTIDICATVTNIGSITATQSTNVQFYEGHPDNGIEIEGPKSIKKLSVDETDTVCIEDFKWWNDAYTHSIWVEVDSIPQERTTLNNIDDGHFTAPKYRFKITPVINSIIYEIFEKIPQLKNIIKF